MATDVTGYTEEMLEGVAQEIAELARTLPKQIFNRPIGTVKVPKDLQYEEYDNRDETYFPSKAQKAMENPENYGDSFLAGLEVLRHDRDMRERKK
jgi:hypothetical protein